MLYLVIVYFVVYIEVNHMNPPSVGSEDKC